MDDDDEISKLEALEAELAREASYISDQRRSLADGKDYVVKNKVSISQVNNSKCHSMHSQIFPLFSCCIFHYLYKEMEDYHNKRLTDAKILQFAALSDLSMLQDIERRSSKNSSSRLSTFRYFKFSGRSVQNSSIGSNTLRSKSSDGPRDEYNKKPVGSSQDTENLVAQQIRLANLREQVSSEKIEWFKSRDEEFKKATELKSRVRRSNLLPKSSSSPSSNNDINNDPTKKNVSTPLSNQEYLDEWLAGKVPDIIPSSLKQSRNPPLSSHGKDNSNAVADNDKASVALQQELNRLKEEIKALREGNITNRSNKNGGDGNSINSNKSVPYNGKFKFFYSKLFYI